MRIAKLGAAILLFVVLSTAAAAAQSLGDVARQERERRAGMAKHAPLITNEDLKRDRILPLPSEGEPTAAASPAASEPVPERRADVPLWRVDEQPGFSLGAYARALRERRKLREQQELAEKQGAQPPAAGASNPLAEIRASLPAVPSQPSFRLKSDVEKKPRALARHARIPSPPRSHAGLETGPPLIRVKRGDSLWRLARAHCGKGSLWRLWWDSNPEISRPDRIFPGQLLRQPGEEVLARHGVRRLQAQAAVAPAATSTAAVSRVMTERSLLAYSTGPAYRQDSRITPP